MSDIVSINTDSADASRHKLDSSIAATPATMRLVLTQMIIEVEREAKRYARSGGAFSSRSKGMLARKIGHQVSGSDIAVLTTGVEYGMIQEVGGTTPAHDIPLRFAKAFRFRGAGGGFVIRSGSKGTPGIIKHPGSRIRPTFYARTSWSKKRQYVLELAESLIRQAAGEKH